MIRNNWGTVDPGPSTIDSSLILQSLHREPQMRSTEAYNEITVLPVEKQSKGIESGTRVVR